jgi:hypothetical protein
MTQRRSTPEERAQAERVLDATLRDPAWVEDTATDCRPGIRGYCGQPDCPKCAPARERAAEQESGER